MDGHWPGSTLYCAQAILDHMALGELLYFAVQEFFLVDHHRWDIAVRNLVECSTLFQEKELATRQFSK